jgi:16S rRNA C1402 N4-methylase RsmH
MATHFFTAIRIIVNYLIKKISPWFRASKVAVNVGKTMLIIFCKKGEVDQYLHLNYDDYEPGCTNPDLIHPINSNPDGCEKVCSRAVGSCI